MRICIIANGYPTKSDPQRGCFEKDQALALLHAGHEVSILYVDRRRLKYGQKFWTTHTTKEGIEVFGICCPLPFLYRISYKWYYKVGTLLLDRVFKYMLRFVPKPDIIHAHFLFNIAYAVSLKKKYNIPLVGTEHWSKLNERLLPDKVHYQANIAYNNTDCLLAVSDSLKQLILSHFGKEAIVLHNMIGEEFLGIQRKEKINGSKIEIVATGSLIYRKGFDVLIKALSRANSKMPDWRLRIIGEGIERDSLQQMIDSYNLGDKIYLIGRHTKNEIIDIYSESDFFVLPSRAENFSVAILEALAAGLPVVGTLCGGIKECINESNGLIVPVDDIDGLANSIMEIATNLHKYDHDSIADNCRQNFSPSVIVHDLTTYYESVFNK